MKKSSLVMMLTIIIAIKGMEQSPPSSPREPTTFEQLVALHSQGRLPLSPDISDDITEVYEESPLYKEAADHPSVQKLVLEKKGYTCSITESLFTNIHNLRNSREEKKLRVNFTHNNEAWDFEVTDFDISNTHDSKAYWRFMTILQKAHEFNKKAEEVQGIRRIQIPGDEFRKFTSQPARDLPPIEEEPLLPLQHSSQVDARPMHGRKALFFSCTVGIGIGMGLLKAGSWLMNKIWTRT